MIYQGLSLMEVKVGLAEIFGGVRNYNREPHSEYIKKQRYVEG